MVQVSRRTSSDEPRTVRRRDTVAIKSRVDAVDDDEEEEEAPPRRSRRVLAEKPSRRRAVIDDDDDEDEEEEPAPRRLRAAKASRRVVDDDDDDEDEEPVSRRSRVSRVVDDDDEDEDEDEPPRRSARKATSPPPGIHVGWSGSEATRKAGGGYDRMAIDAKGEPSLIRFLEPEPFVSARQHWIRTDGKTDRPYICIGSDCPLCELGDQTTAMYAFNVLHLSEDGEPAVKILQIGTRAFQSLKETATNKATGKIDLNRGFWSVQKTGRGAQTQTNFRPVKERDLEDDWPEVLVKFDVEDLPAIIKKAQKRLYDYTVFPVSTRKQLREIARYLADED